MSDGRTSCAIDNWKPEGRNPCILIYHHIKKSQSPRNYSIHNINIIALVDKSKPLAYCG
jgi:hypothetical protein